MSEKIIAIRLKALTDELQQKLRSAETMVSDFKKKAQTPISIKVNTSLDKKKLDDFDKKLKEPRLVKIKIEVDSSSVDAFYKKIGSISRQSGSNLNAPRQQFNARGYFNGIPNYYTASASTTSSPIRGNPWTAAQSRYSPGLESPQWGRIPGSINGVSTSVQPIQHIGSSAVPWVGAAAIVAQHNGIRDIHEKNKSNVKRNVGIGLGLGLAAAEDVGVATIGHFAHFHHHAAAAHAAAAHAAAAHAAIHTPVTPFMASHSFMPGYASAIKATSISKIAGGGFAKIASAFGHIGLGVAGVAGAGYAAYKRYSNHDIGQSKDFTPDYRETQAVEMMDGPHCPRCGEANSSKASNCRRCGNDLRGRTFTRIAKDIGTVGKTGVKLAAKGGEVVADSVAEKVLGSGTTARKLAKTALGGGIVGGILHYAAPAIARFIHPPLKEGINELTSPGHIIKKTAGFLYDVATSPILHHPIHNAMHYLSALGSSHPTTAGLAGAMIGGAGLTIGGKILSRFATPGQIGGFVKKAVVGTLKAPLTLPLRFGQGAAGGYDFGLNNKTAYGDASYEYLRRKDILEASNPVEKLSYRVGNLFGGIGRGLNVAGYGIGAGIRKIFKRKQVTIPEPEPKSLDDIHKAIESLGESHADIMGAHAGALLGATTTGSSSTATQQGRDISRGGIGGSVTINGQPIKVEVVNFPGRGGDGGGGKGREDGGGGYYPKGPKSHLKPSNSGKTPYSKEQNQLYEDITAAGLNRDLAQLAEKHGSGKVKVGVPLNRYGNPYLEPMPGLPHDMAEIMGPHRRRAAGAPEGEQYGDLPLISSSGGHYPNNITGYGGNRWGGSAIAGPQKLLTHNPEGDTDSIINKLREESRRVAGPPTHIIDPSRNWKLSPGDLEASMDMAHDKYTPGGANLLNLSMGKTAQERQDRQRIRDAQHDSHVTDNLINNLDKKNLPRLTLGSSIIPIHPDDGTEVTEGTHARTTLGGKHFKGRKVFNPKKDYAAHMFGQPPVTDEDEDLPRRGPKGRGSRGMDISAQENTIEYGESELRAAGMGNYMDLMYPTGKKPHGGPVTNPRKTSSGEDYSDKSWGSAYRRRRRKGSAPIIGMAAQGFVNIAGTSEETRNTIENARSISHETPADGLKEIGAALKSATIATRDFAVKGVGFATGAIKSLFSHSSPGGPNHPSAMKVVSSGAEEPASGGKSGGAILPGQTKNLRALGLGSMAKFARVSGPLAIAAVALAVGKEYLAKQEGKLHDLNQFKLSTLGGNNATNAAAYAAAMKSKQERGGDDVFSVENLFHHMGATETYDVKYNGGKYQKIQEEAVITQGQFQSKENERHRSYERQSLGHTIAAGLTINTQQQEQERIKDEVDQKRNAAYEHYWMQLQLPGADKDKLEQQYHADVKQADLYGKSQWNQFGQKILQTERGISSHNVALGSYFDNEGAMRGVKGLEGFNTYYGARQERRSARAQELEEMRRNGKDKGAFQSVYQAKVKEFGLQNKLEDTMNLAEVNTMSVSSGFSEKAASLRAQGSNYNANLADIRGKYATALSNPNLSKEAQLEYQRQEVAETFNFNKMNDFQAMLHGQGLTTNINQQKLSNIYMPFAAESLGLAEGGAMQIQAQMRNGNDPNARPIANKIAELTKQQLFGQNKTLRDLNAYGTATEIGRGVAFSAMWDRDPAHDEQKIADTIKANDKMADLMQQFKDGKIDAGGLKKAIDKIDPSNGEAKLANDDDDKAAAATTAAIKDVYNLLLKALGL